jgi:hypothetical protein
MVGWQWQKSSWCRSIVMRLYFAAYEKTGMFLYMMPCNWTILHLNWQGGKRNDNSPQNSTHNICSGFDVAISPWIIFIPLPADFLPHLRGLPYCENIELGVLTGYE